MLVPARCLPWALLCVASVPFAFTFASLSSRKPESGGIYSFAKEAFGPHIATVTGWLFGLWVITGAPAITLIAASYLGYAGSTPENCVKTKTEKEKEEDSMSDRCMTQETWREEL